MFVLKSVFLTRLLALGIFFSSAVGAVVVTKFTILGILFLTSFILALRRGVAAKLVIVSISLLTSFILALRVVLTASNIRYFIYNIFYLSIVHIFLNNIIFYTTSFSLLKSTWTDTNLSTSNLPCFSNCWNYLTHFSIYQYLIYLHQILN